MRDDIAYVYSYFRRKGFGRRMSLSMAQYCCDPTRPYTSNLENTK
jgi:hypothetical protein